MEKIKREEWSTHWWTMLSNQLELGINETSLTTQFPPVFIEHCRLAKDNRDTCNH